MSKSVTQAAVIGLTRKNEAVRPNSPISECSSRASAQSQDKCCEVPKRQTLRSKGFHNLPRGVLTEVFSYFSEKEISQNLAPVCTNWRLASRHPSLWKKLDFNGSLVSCAYICRMLRSAPLLETAKFTRVPDIVRIIRQLCRCNPNLKNLSVKYCTNQNDEIIPEVVFRNMISSCPNLEVLNLKGTQFHGRSFYYDLEHLRNLRSLTLGTNKYLRVQDLFVIVQISHKLEELKISRLIKRREETPLTDQDAVFLFDSLKNSICSLEFDLRNLGSPTIQAIFDCSKITKLGLYNAFSLSSELFRTIGNHLPNLSRLKICSASQLTSEDFSFVFTNYKENMRALVHLDVSGCWRLADSGLKSIADACSESLQKLSIKSCKLITNDGLEYAINRCPNLKQLNIAHAIKISDSCVTKFPSMLPRLKLLVVDRSNQKLNSLTSLVSPNRHITVKESL